MGEERQDESTETSRAGGEDPMTAEQSESAERAEQRHEDLDPAQKAAEVKGGAGRVRF